MKKKFKKIKIHSSPRQLFYLNNKRIIIKKFKIIKLKEKIYFFFKKYLKKKKKYISFFLNIFINKNIIDLKSVTYIDKLIIKINIGTTTIFYSIYISLKNIYNRNYKKLYREMKFNKNNKNIQNNIKYYFFFKKKNKYLEFWDISNLKTDKMHLWGFLKYKNK